jgi:hypothetical protein
VARRLALGDHRPLVVLTSTREASDYGTRLATSAAGGFIAKQDLSGAALASLLMGSAGCG